MQSRVAFADAPFPCRWVDRPAPSSSREIQREARRPNARGRLSLNKTPMAEVTRALVPPWVPDSPSPPPPPAPKRETKSPLPPKPTGGSPLPEIQKKEKPPTSPKTGGGTPPSVKIEENSFKKKIKKRKKKKEKLVTSYFCCE